MRIRLTEPRSIRGIDVDSGTVLELHDSLAQRLILSGAAVYAAQSSIDDADLNDLKKDELIGLAKEMGVDVHPKMKKDEIIAAINAS